MSITYLNSCRTVITLNILPFTVDSSPASSLKSNTAAAFMKRVIVNIKSAKLKSIVKWYFVVLFCNDLMSLIPLQWLSEFEMN